MPLQHKNFLSALRKSMLSDFGLIQEGADTSWIASKPIPPPEAEDLASQIVGGAGQVFTLTTTPNASFDSAGLYWNGLLVHEGVGYTRSGNRIEMAAGYEPAIGDTLVAVIRA